jgi:quinoprotein glucose dehydrogenase
MTYRLRPDGRQFVVIAAGGHFPLGSPPDDALIAYALPEPDSSGSATASD